MEDKLVSMQSVLGLVESVNYDMDRGLVENNDWYTALKTVLPKLPAHARQSDSRRCLSCRWWGLWLQESENSSSKSTTASLLPCKYTATHSTWFCGSWEPKTRLDDILRAIDCSFHYNCEKCPFGFQMEVATPDGVVFECDYEKILRAAYEYLKDHRNNVQYDPGVDQS